MAAVLDPRPVRPLRASARPRVPARSRVPLLLALQRLFFVAIAVRRIQVFYVESLTQGLHHQLVVQVEIVVAEHDVELALGYRDGDVLVLAAAARVDVVGDDELAVREEVVDVLAVEARVARASF